MSNGNKVVGAYLHFGHFAGDAVLCSFFKIVFRCLISFVKIKFLTSDINY